MGAVADGRPELAKAGEKPARSTSSESSLPLQRHDLQSLSLENDKTRLPAKAGRQRAGLQLPC